ncbi:Chemotaxis protein CheY [Marinomonas spartinae]|uniref:Chemotaxis protein CheY n=2 Tax=Marinomonas spartinae TaxID=1792290 RepID=A0A1A8TRT1_9GAMM|nr:Chemotaxis protein CheY [Marinomonas spartinae]
MEVITKSDAAAEQRVLIIESIAEMRFLLKSLMVSLGYEKIDFEISDQSAIKRIQAIKYDIILSDFNADNKINGQQILEATRKHYNLDHPVIFMMITADRAYESVVSILEYQPDCYLVKPFTPAAFHRRLKRVVKQRTVFDLAHQARKQKDYITLERVAKAIIKHYPQYASQCLRVIGESIYQRGEYQSASAHYAKVLQRNHELAWAHFGMAQCHIKLNQLKQAIETLEQTIELNQYFFSAYDLLVDLYLELNQPKEAQEIIIKALLVSPRSYERSLRLGRISIDLEDWLTAEQALSKAIRSSKDNNSDTPALYYDYLKTITELIENDIEAPRLIEKFHRALTRLRKIGQNNPEVVTNSFRLEVQNLLARGLQKDAVKAWHTWGRRISMEEAEPLTPHQEITLKKMLGLRF